MDISPQVEMILEVLQQYTTDGLRDEALFASFMQHAQNSGKQEALGALAFHGKYLRNLYLTVQRQTQESELFEKLEQEFSRAVNDFHGMVSAFVADAEEDFRSTVERHALEVNENGLKNLLALAEDFSALKNLELDVLQNEESDGEVESYGMDSEERDSDDIDSEEADFYEMDSDEMEQ
ncbi:MAG: hypothetical protein WBQ23_03795 [Bacteroidota bacterium]